MASTGSVNLLSALVMKPALSELADAFSHRTGQTLTIIYDAAVPIRDRIRNGEAFDATIVQRQVLEMLAQEGAIEPDSVITLARSGIAMAAHTGKPKPATKPVEALKQTLLAATSIAYPDPAIGHASGLQFQEVIERLGISDTIRPKAKLMTGTLADFAMQDEAEIAITQPMEILATPGYELVGWLPPELQDAKKFTWGAGVTTNSKEPDTARALVRFLSSPAATSVIESWGMVPDGR